jgi:Pilus formation protein N terminal region
MMAFVHRGAFRPRALAATLAACVLSASASAADIDVTLDQAKLVKLPEGIATLVIGNPVIADVAVQSGGWIVITGKGYGKTNLIALDRTGAVLLERSVEVQGPPGVVVVYKGVERESYSCTPLCERRLTLGDRQPYFEGVSKQVEDRNKTSAGASQSK